MLRILLFGLGVWATPFLVGMAIFPFQSQKPELFDTIMSVTVVIATTFLGFKYFTHEGRHDRHSGWKVGLIWMAVCLGIDLPILVVGLGMPVTTYAEDIGLTYAIVPTICVGMSAIKTWAADPSRSKKNG